MIQYGFTFSANTITNTHTHTHLHTLTQEHIHTIHYQPPSVNRLIIIRVTLTSVIINIAITDPSINTVSIRDHNLLNRPRLDNELKEYK